MGAGLHAEQNANPMTADAPMLSESDAATGALRHLVRNKIFELESEMLRHEQLDIPVTHHFAPGIYAREITIPAGALVVGKVHRFGHVNIISSGDISVMTEDGPRRIKAPCTIISKPGTKRVGFAYADTVWTTIHATDETDLEKLESQLILPGDDREGIEQFIEQLT